MEWIQYKDKYLVSEYGDVKNLLTGRILKGEIHYKGYKRVFSNLNGNKRMFVHRLVAMLFIPNPLGLPQVNHLDGNKLNNHKSNLQWCTDQENQEHAIINGLKTMLFVKGEKHINAKLTLEQVKDIKYSLTKVSTLAKKYSIKPITIYKIRDNSLWKDV